MEARHRPLAFARASTMHLAGVRGPRSRGFASRPRNHEGRCDAIRARRARGPARTIAVRSRRTAMRIALATVGSGVGIAAIALGPLALAADEAGAKLVDAKAATVVELKLVLKSGDTEFPQERLGTVGDPSGGVMTGTVGGVRPHG